MFAIMLWLHTNLEFGSVKSFHTEHSCMRLKNCYHIYFINCLIRLLLVMLSSKQFLLTHISPNKSTRNLIPNKITPSLYHLCAITTSTPFTWTSLCPTFIIHRSFIKPPPISICKSAKSNPHSVSKFKRVGA